MAFVNEVRISGRAVKDAARVGNGPYRFSIATGGGKKRGSEERWPSEFFDVSCWHESAADVKRASEVHIVGRLRQSQWEKDGQKHSRVEIVANEITSAETSQKPLTPKYDLPAVRAVQHAQKVASVRPVTTSDPITDADIPF